MSYISNLKTKYKRNRELIQAMLEINPVRHNMLVFVNGNEYLSAMMPHDADGRKTLGDSKDYWAWWVNQWNLTDRAWLEKVLERPITPPLTKDGNTQGGEAGLGDAAALLAEYYQLHDTQLNHLYPNTTMIRTIYLQHKNKNNG
jgi:hypothetical protein